MAQTYSIIYDDSFITSKILKTQVYSHIIIGFRDALSSNGVLIIKENVTSSGKTEVDDTDSSVTRPLKSYLKIFNAAKLKRIKQCKQTNFPTGIYPVYMFALIPN